MSSVLSRIGQWATTLPYWEQAAFQKVVSGATLVDADYDKLLQYLLEDSDPPLAKPSQQRPALTYAQTLATAATAPSKPLRLAKLSNLCNVNALAPNQVLTFGPSLTVVYGANASGKSGYARVIASAAFTRGDRGVLRDIGKPFDSSKPISADIELTDGQTPKTVKHRVGQSCPEMGSFYVFDSTSAKAHLMRSNPMSFSPGGLEYLTALSDVTDEVRKRLQRKIAELTRPNSFAALFPGASAVSVMIQTLGAGTDINQLDKLATISPEDTTRLALLDKKITELKSKRVPEEIAQFQLMVDALRRLYSSISDIIPHLTESKVEKIQSRLADWRKLSNAVQALSVNQFKSEHFSETGSDAWHSFVKAAHALAAAESKNGQPYPQSDSRCLLCQQPLSAEARLLLQRLWGFLESDAQSKLAFKDHELQEDYRDLSGLRADVYREDTLAWQCLQGGTPDVHAKVVAYVSSLQAQRNALMEAITAKKEPALATLPESPLNEIRSLGQNLISMKEELERKNPAEELAELEREKRELEDRQKLAPLLSQIKDYVNTCLWISCASQPSVRGSTNHITRKYNELFSELVTVRYVKLFDETLKELKCNLKVRVETKGEKAETRKQVVLVADKTVPADQTSPEKVLSEGEQKAVALADFFTEVELDDNSSGVVLDDPVTSLDFEWKETVAKHVVTQARKRQVVVFTHDLHFLYCLKENASAQSVEVAAHWIQKCDGKPGCVFTSNSPMSERDYKNAEKVKEIHRQASATGISPEEQQRLLQEGFGALRTCYEAFVMFELFGGVVLRFDERLRIERLKDVVIDVTIRNEVIGKVGLLSRYIEGHSHSDAFAAQKPTPDVLLKEIQEFESIKKRHRQFKKDQGITN